MGPEINIRILSFIMFGSTSSLGLRNNSETCKSYRAPHAQTQKRRRGRGGFSPLIQIIKKDKERYNMPGVEWDHLRQFSMFGGLFFGDIYYT